MAALVLHYDQSESNFSGFTSVTQPSMALPHGLDIKAVKKIVVLLSPSFYKQRCRFYEGTPNIETRPLLFQWSDLTASQIKGLMRIEAEDTAPLYMGVILDLLRQFQRDDELPAFSEFMSALKDPRSKQFLNSQSTPLRQRLELLESFVADSDRNKDLPSVSLADVVQSGTVVIADLTDPLLSPAEANGVFHILVESFRSLSIDCGRLLCMDEAHKYLSRDSGDLAKTVVDVVRQMRHFGIRVAISTQSPLVLPAELLELVSVAVVHQFQSRDWLAYLGSKLPLRNKHFREILTLEPGSALVYCSRTHTSPRENASGDDFAGESDEDFDAQGQGPKSEIASGPDFGESQMKPKLIRLQIRKRLTRDSGASVVN